MKAVYINEFSGPDGLEIREVADAREPGNGEVTVKVAAVGLNRADLLQVRGMYPPPEGTSPNIPGLEFAGIVTAAGEGAAFSVGDRVFGIAAGESQAEFITVDARHIAVIPENLSLVEAAAIPEVFVTAYDAAFTQARLRSPETLLVHAVGSGVGLAAMQLAKAFGCTVIGTSRTAEKIDKTVALGLDHGIVTDVPQFADDVLKFTEGRGADVVLDLVGGAYLIDNVKTAAAKGRIMLVGLTAGSKAELDMGLVLRKRLTIIGTALRGRSADEKASAIAAFEENVLPLFAAGTIVPNIDRIYSFDDVAEAYRYVASNESFGKVVLSWDAEDTANA